VLLDIFLRLIPTVLVHATLFIPNYSYLAWIISV
jgi:hypothetical protein